MLALVLQAELAGQVEMNAEAVHTLSHSVTDKDLDFWLEGDELLQLATKCLIQDGKVTLLSILK